MICLKHKYFCFQSRQPWTIHLVRTNWTLIVIHLNSTTETKDSKSPFALDYSVYVIYASNGRTQFQTLLFMLELCLVQRHLKSERSHISLNIYLCTTNWCKLRYIWYNFGIFLIRKQRVICDISWYKSVSE